MKDNNIKKEFHWFLLTDYEREEEFLRKKNKEGYRLIKTTLPGIYTFEKCEPEDVIYRLDFNTLADSEVAEYMQIYADYGWEYITEMNDYNYFRKPASEIQLDKEAEIFSDSESKLDMLKNIFQRKMIPILLVFIFLGIPQIMDMFTGFYKGALKDTVSVIWSILFLLYLYIFIYCGVGYFKLKKKYSHD